MELFEDGVRGSRPLEGVARGIVVAHEVLDPTDEFPHVVERSASDGALRDQPEPAFDFVEPRTVGRSADSTSEILSSTEVEQWSIQLQINPFS